MIEFLRIQFRLNRITGSDLDKLVTEGKITEENKTYIMSQ